MKFFDSRKRVAILRVLRAMGRPLGGARLARELQSLGLDLKPRTLRLYLERLEADGLVEAAGARGRQITPAGLAELKRAAVVERVGLTAARVDALAYQTTFRISSCSGRVVVNASLVDRHRLADALIEAAAVFKAGLGMGCHMMIAGEGEEVGDLQVPPGKALIGTVCSVTINGILLGLGIPVVSRFGGVLELEDGKPVRFTDVIHYDGSSLDPMEIFIRSRLTSVGEAARTGRGRIGAGLREIPSAAVPEVEKITRKLERVGLNGILAIGRRNQPLLDFPMPEGRTGMIVAGGLNPISAVEEAGIPTTNHAMHGLVEFERFRPYQEWIEETLGAN